ncbi:Nematode cuticle collagen domain protein [Aphelenchoides besseyi]|nr:Nematode cuticle collagen domain protein [Aphelenchoides besseyi]
MIVESEIREKAYRFVAYSAVGFSLAAILAVFITLPIVNNYVNSVHNRVYHEMEFCKMSAKEVMLEMNEYRALPRMQLPPMLHLNELNNHTNSRFRRSTAAAQCEGCNREINQSANLNLGCCLPGLPGPPVLFHDKFDLIVHILGTSGTKWSTRKTWSKWCSGLSRSPTSVRMLLHQLNFIISRVCEEITEPPCTPCAAGEIGLPGPPGEPLDQLDCRNFSFLNQYLLDYCSGRSGNDGAPGPQGPVGPNDKSEIKDLSVCLVTSESQVDRALMDQWDRRLVDFTCTNSNPFISGTARTIRTTGITVTFENSRLLKSFFSGKQGEIGRVGAPGQDGERGICPKYCSIDGGIFFEDGTRR